MQRLRFSLFVAVSVLLITPFAAHAQYDTINWEGNYVFEASGGALPVGMEVVYMGPWNQVTWFTDQATAIVGVGLPVSSTQLAVASESSCVLQVFNIAADGSMNGTWASAFTGLGQATATPAPGTSANRVYHSQGVNPDGSPFAGTLEIALAGTDVFTLAWSYDDGTHLDGVGLQSGDHLLVAADADLFTDCTVGVITKFDDGSIQWDWARQNASTSITTNRGSVVRLANRYSIEGLELAGNAEYTGELRMQSGPIPSRFSVGFTVEQETPVSAVAMVRGNRLMYVYGGQQCIAVNHAVMADGRLFTLSANMMDVMIGVTVQNVIDSSEGMGTFTLGGDAIGSVTVAPVTEEVYASDGIFEIAQDTPVDMDGIYLRDNGFMAGVYAPGGDVSDCYVQSGLIAPDGTISMDYTKFGSSDILGSELLTPLT